MAACWPPIATLGLLQMGHETSPEMVQLALVSLFMWAFAAAPFRTWPAPVAVVHLPAFAGLERHAQRGRGLGVLWPWS